MTSLASENIETKTSAKKKALVTKTSLVDMFFNTINYKPISLYPWIRKEEVLERDHSINELDQFVLSGIRASKSKSPAKPLKM